jgi:hypothetical protein
MNPEKLWVVQRQQGSQWFWWCADSSGYSTELVHAGLYTEDQALTHQRLHDRKNPNGAYDHKAITLAEALGTVKPGTVGDMLGLRTQ